MIHAEIKQGGVGNCIPLEDVDILISSSVCQKEPEDIINETNINYFSDNSWKLFFKRPWLHFW